MEHACYSCSPIHYSKGGGTLICVCSNRKRRKQWNDADKLKYLYKCCYSIIRKNIK